MQSRERSECVGDDTFQEYSNYSCNPRAESAPQSWLYTQAQGDQMNCFSGRTWELPAWTLHEEQSSPKRMGSLFGTEYRIESMKRIQRGTYAVSEQSVSSSYHCSPGLKSTMPSCRAWKFLLTAESWGGSRLYHFYSRGGSETFSQQM